MNPFLWYYNNKSLLYLNLSLFQQNKISIEYNMIALKF